MGKRAEDGRRLAIPGAFCMAPGNTRVFRFLRGGRLEEGFLVRHAGGFAAYRNVCAHADAPLDMGDARFFDDEGRRLLCRLHGAEYRPDDGICVAGPCVGEALEALGVEDAGGEVVVILAPGDRPAG